MQEGIRLDAIFILLVRPRFPENIGSVARAMKNMGLSRLVIVGGASPLNRNAYKLASGAYEILERAEEFPTLKEAIAELECVVGTTSRMGKERGPLLTPRELAKKLVSLSKRNRIGIVFGSEKEGLTNEELSLCHLYTKIPTSESFPSLNLAQAVMVLCYELFQTRIPVSTSSPRLASSMEMERMFEHMERTLLDIGFLEANNPKRIMRTLRRLFGRSQLEERDVRILQGIWSKVDWIRKQVRGDP
jgi:tRNA/rRNA methyltransferase